MMICNYLSFLIEEIWVDWQDNILFGIILFSVLANFNLTCGIWAFQIIRYRPLGPSGWAFVLRWHQRAWISHGAHPFFGPSEWAGEPVCLTLSVLY